VIPAAAERIRRYCGRIAGPGPEVWAWDYYDMVPTPHDARVSATDVMVAGAVHPGISKADLTFFSFNQHALADWLAALPTDTSIYAADDATLDHLASAVQFEPHVSITLLTKVLHRKRPQLIPLLDRHIIDWYRPVTGERSATAAWAPMLRAMRDDADESDQFMFATVSVRLAGARQRPDRIGPEADLLLSRLRAVDIAIWMGSR
jgi:hypothetical protein